MKGAPQWAVELPESWSVKPLKAVADYQVSNVDKIPADDELPVRLCNYTDVYKNDFIHAGMTFMKGTATQREIEKFGLREGDVIITKDSETWDDIGIPALVTQTADDLVCGYHLAMLRPMSGKMRGDFLLRCLQSHAIRVHLELAALGVTRFGLPKDEIGKMPLPVPPLDEQDRIAHYLTEAAAQIDSLVTAKERWLELLAEKRQALITHAVTRGINPKAQTVKTGVEWLPTVPQHWTPARISRLFKQTKRVGFPDLTVLSVYRDYGVIERSTRDDNANRIPDDLSIYQLVRPGDLVINKMKAWQGSLGIAEIEGITSADYVVFSRVHQEDPRFLHFLLRNQLLTTVYLSMSNGIRTNQWRIEPDRFASLNLFLPPLAEQRAIVAHIAKETAKLDALRAAAENSIALLKERRGALISAAVTGKLRVSAKSGVAEGSAKMV